MTAPRASRAERSPKDARREGTKGDAAVLARMTTLRVLLVAATLFAAGSLLGSAVPDVSPVGTAKAGPCIMGDDDGCIILIHCPWDCDDPPSKEDQ